MIRAFEAHGQKQTFVVEVGTDQFAEWLNIAS
jgi:hypothetical protein